MSVDERVVADLAPQGVLRAGINLSNFLLVRGCSASGEPEGVSPDLARAIADRLGLALRYVTYPQPGALAAAAASDAWDIGLIAAEPARARTIAFSPAYVEIESTYLVPAGSPLETIADVDRPGIRIAVSAGSAYDLWLSRHVAHAELVRADGIEASFQAFEAGKLEALAGLRPRLIQDVERLPGARIMAGRFTAVQQAVGTPSGREAGAAFLRDFVEEAKRSGLVAELIRRHGACGLSVAGPDRDRPAGH